MIVSKKDKLILRDLAKTQLEFANSPENIALKKEWIRNNECIKGRPMITVEWGTFEKEAIGPLLKTEGKIAREIEKKILSGYVGQMLFGDDSVVNDYIALPKCSYFKPFGLKVKVDKLEDSVGHHFVEQIEDLADDFHKLKPSKYGIVNILNNVSNSYLENLVGDILPIKNVVSSLYSVPTQDVVHIMGLENMMFAMYDYPDEFHKMMDMLTDDYVAYFKHLESKNFLLPMVGSEWVGQGTYAFNDTLKKEGTNIKLNDVWGFMDSQESSTISPDMYQEFIFPYYKKVASLFGLFSYGCCEPVHSIWDNCLSKLDNLRKVSISPWCDEEIMGERLAGKKVVYHRKPSPNFLGVDKELNKEGLREHIKKTVKATKNCTVEFTQRDVYTVHNNMQKVRDYVRIIREETTK